jgi:hypothetical protein
LLLDFVDLIVELGVGVLVVFVHKIWKSAQPSSCNEKESLPAKLDSASVNSISSLYGQLCTTALVHRSLHSLSSVPMDESFSSEKLLELLVRSQEDLCRNQPHPFLQIKDVPLMAVVLATRVAEVPPPRGGTLQSVVSDELGIYPSAQPSPELLYNAPKGQSEQSSCSGSRRLRSRYHAYSSSFLGRRQRLSGIYQGRGQWQRAEIFAGRERQSMLGRFRTALSAWQVSSKG